MVRSKRGLCITVFSVCLAGLVLSVPSYAQMVPGRISGTARDASVESLGDATMKARNKGTDLEASAKTHGKGAHSIGLEMENHMGVQLDGSTTTTVDGNLGRKNSSCVVIVQDFWGQYFSFREGKFFERGVKQ